MGNFVGEVTSPVIVKSEGDYEIHPGDLAIYDASSVIVKPASGVPHGASEAADQQAIHDKFLGVALSTAHQDGSASSVRVAVTGVFNMIASGSVAFGDLVGTVTTGSNIENQKIKTVANRKYAIGTAQSQASDGQRVMVRIKSVVFDDGRVAIAT